MVCCNSKYLSENDLMLSYLDQLLVEQIKTSDLDTKSRIYTSEENNQFPVGLSIYSGSHSPTQNAVEIKNRRQKTTMSFKTANQKQLQCPRQVHEWQRDKVGNLQFESGSYTLKYGTINSYNEA